MEARRLAEDYILVVINDPIHIKIGGYGVLIVVVFGHFITESFLRHCN